MVHFGELLKPEACGQTESILKRQKLVKNSKIPKFKFEIFGYFQTMLMQRVPKNLGQIQIFVFGC